MTSLLPLSAAEGRGDTGTIRISWEEFHTQKTEKAGISFGKGYFNTEIDTEWAEYEVRFEATNKESTRKKLRVLVSIFDKSNNLIFAASKDKGIEGLHSEEVKCEAKISSNVKFEPDTVFVRIWWE